MSGTDPEASTGRWTASMASRLLAAQLLVVVAGAITAWVVAGTVGPPLFGRHLAHAGADVPPAADVHAQEAYRSATIVSLTVALVVATAIAAVVSLFVTRRIGHSVASVADAARQVADRGLGARVPPPGLGREFEDLADAFNRMAMRLDASEAARRRLLADLAHELRTPISVIAGYLDGIADGIRTADADTLAVLSAQTSRLARLADDLAAVSQADEHRLDLHVLACSPADLVRTAATGAAPGYDRAHLQLTVDLPDRLPDVLADPDRIGQVLANLLDNARRHTPAGGHVTISAAATPPPTAALAIRVTDTGDGIPADDLPRVFDRFYRVGTARDRSHGGSGLGLTIAQAITHAHGGQITAASAGPGRGATFTVTLPGGADRLQPK